VQAVLGWQAGQDGERDTLRKPQHGAGEAGDEIGAGGRAIDRRPPAQKRKYAGKHRVCLVHSLPPVNACAVACLRKSFRAPPGRSQSIGRPPRWKRLRTRSSSSSPEKYEVSSHITLTTPNASAS